MYFEESQINQILICKICKKRLDKPNILPCGAVICTFCVLAKKIVNNIFECCLCSSEHAYPPNGFPQCEPLIEILYIKPIDMHRCESVRQLFELQNKIEAFRISKNTGSKLIKEYCSDLRSQVQSAASLCTQRILALQNKITLQVDQYEEQLNKSLEKNKEEHRDDYNRIVNEIDKLTRQYETNENSVFATIEIYQKLEEEKIKLNEIVFKRNYLKFHVNNMEQLNEAILGSFSSIKEKNHINS